MTKEEAGIEARNRWGDNARIRVYKPREDEPAVYKVGIAVMGGLFQTRGVGYSWEEAFERASKKNKAKA